MFDELKRLFKHSSFYGIASLLNKANAILLLPIYTRFLTPDEYGMLEILLITSTFIFLILQSGIGSALFRTIIYKEGTDRNTIISTSFYYQIFSSIIIIIILCFFSKEISFLIFETDKFVTILNIIFIFAFIKVIPTIPQAILRIDERSHIFIITAGANFFLGIIINIIFVVILKKGVYGIILANLINAGVFAVIYLGFIIKNLRQVCDFKELKDMLGFGLPLVPASIAAMILTLADRYFLEYYSTLKEVGLYSIGYRIGMIISLFVGAFQMAWPAVMFAIAKKDNAKEIFSRLLSYFLFIFFFIGLGLSIFAKDLLVIAATEPFYQAYKIVPMVVVSYIFYGLYFFTTIGIQIKKKTIYMPIIIGITALINLILNYLLIPKHGMYGAAIATVISYAFLAFASGGISLRFYRIRYEYFEIFKIVIVSALLFYLASLFNRMETNIMTILIKLFILFLFPLLLFVLQFFNKKELAKIKQMLSLV